MPLLSQPALPDRYEVTTRIASGGMGTVWAAQDLVLGRLVAVKVLAPHFLSDADAMARFEREARAAAALSHRNIVTVFDFGEHDGHPFIVMQHYGGGTVADATHGGPASHERSIGWLRDAAAGLDFAHSQGVVHRDVKPANLLLHEGGGLAVGDFGIARLAWESAVTGTGQVLGTASYIAPEQAQGERATEASDRYALAVVAYELLTGAKPFTSGSFAAQARQHVDSVAQPPSHRAPALSGDVDGVVARGMAKAPRDRWPSCLEFVEVLERALPVSADNTTRVVAASPVASSLASREGSGPRAPRIPAVAAPPAIPPPVPGRAPRSAPGLSPAPSEPRRHRLAILGAVAAVAIALATILALTAGGGDDGGRKTTTAGAKNASGASTTANTTQQTPSPSNTPAPSVGKTQANTAPAAPTGDSAVLNARGFALMRQGDYAGAVPVLEQAIKNCLVSQTSPCAYAYFNLGHSLRLAGRPAEAISVLETRSQNPDQAETVAQELAAARQAAGQVAGNSSPKPKEKHGKGR